MVACRAARGRQCFGARRAAVLSVVRRHWRGGVMNGGCVVLLCCGCSGVCRDGCRSGADGACD
jgi:hypothetical protein